MDEENNLRVKGYTMSPILFEKGFPSGGGPCSCTSVCCEGGVYADVRERDNILLHKEMIRKYMDETQITDELLWFEEVEQEDADFPSGRCVGTREINNKCAFLDRSGRCSIQVASASEGMHKWALKPLFCILYPIEITDKVVSFDEMLQDEQSCCSVTPDFSTPVFEGCKEELVHLVGEDGYRMMMDHYASKHQRQAPQ
jgi:hypothetical protein